MCLSLPSTKSSTIAIAQALGTRPFHLVEGLGHQHRVRLDASFPKELLGKPAATPLTPLTPLALPLARLKKATVGGTPFDGHTVSHKYQILSNCLQLHPVVRVIK